MANRELEGIFYRVEGPPGAHVVVFVHGIGMNHRTFEPQIEALASRYRVAVLDLPGHGKSAGADLGSRFSQRAADCAAGILDELGVTQAVFVGQSLGSLVVQHVVTRHPERVRATVHLGGMPLHPGYSRLLGFALTPVVYLCRLIPAQAFYRSFAAHRAIKAETKRFMEQAISENGKDLVIQLTMETLKDMTDGLPHSIPTPCLILFGDQEVSFVRKRGRKWHEEVPGSELEVIPQAGHIANQDNPDSFNTSLARFLDGLPDAGSE